MSFISRCLYQITAGIAGFGSWGGKLQYIIKMWGQLHRICTKVCNFAPKIRRKKGDRQSAANILPILVKKGLIQDYHHKK